MTIDSAITNSCRVAKSESPHGGNINLFPIESEALSKIVKNPSDIILLKRHSKGYNWSIEIFSPHLDEKEIERCLKVNNQLKKRFS